MTRFFLHYDYGNVIKYFASARHGTKHFPGFSNFVLLAILFYFYFTDQENKWCKVKQSVPSRVITDKITPLCNDVLRSRSVPGPVPSAGTIRSFSAYNYSGQDSVLQTWAQGHWGAHGFLLALTGQPWRCTSVVSVLWRQTREDQPGLRSETLSQNSNNK